MKIRTLLNIGSASGFPPLPEGEHEVESEIGLSLIARGWAVANEPAPTEVKGIPPTPSMESVVAPATEQVKGYRGRASRVTEPNPKDKEQ
jgi:hypothetical protein